MIFGDNYCRTSSFVRHVQIQAQLADDFEPRGEFGVAVGREGLVETFATEAGLASDLGHALGAGDVAEGGE